MFSFGSVRAKIPVDAAGVAKRGSVMFVCDSAHLLRIQIGRECVVFLCPNVMFINYYLYPRRLTITLDTFSCNS